MRFLISRLPVLMLLALLAACSTQQAANQAGATVTEVAPASNQLPVEWTLISAPKKYDSFQKVTTRLGVPLQDRDTEGTIAAAGYSFRHAFTFNLEGKVYTHEFNVLLRNVSDVIFMTYQAPNGEYRFIPLGYVRESAGGQNLRLIDFADPPTLNLKDVKDVLPNTIAA